MPQTCMITIDEKPDEELAEFNPQTQTVKAGDIVNWCNNTCIPHWPAPKDQPKDTWMDAEIPGKLPDEPPPTSQQQLSFAGAMTVDYVCALHPEETGTIIVE